MSRLIILGAGGHGRVVADAAEEAAGWDAHQFLDDRSPGLSSSGAWQVIGRIRDLELHLDEQAQYVVAIGHAGTRIRLVDVLETHAMTIASVIHPRAAISRYAVIGRGAVVFAGACVNVGAKLGRAVIVNTGATVDHDCELGDAVHVCPGAHLAGDVKVGEGTWIGIGASVRQGIAIGAHVMVAAGAAVVSDIPPGTTVLGVPARAKGH